MPPQNRITSKNLLLAALSAEDLQCYFSDLYPVSLSLRQVLYEVGAPLEHVYFIEQGVASVLTNMADGSTIEVGMIGTEGMVGVPALRLRRLQREYTRGTNSLQTHCWREMDSNLQYRAA